jgi:hypothetical protein
MTQAHATQKGAIGLELGDEKGSKEMIDAPMLKQVNTLVHFSLAFRSPNFLCPGREDNSDGASCRPSHSNTALTKINMAS